MLITKLGQAQSSVFFITQNLISAEVNKSTVKLIKANLNKYIELCIMFEETLKMEIPNDFDFKDFISMLVDVRFAELENLSNIFNIYNQILEMIKNRNHNFGKKNIV